MEKTNKYYGIIKELVRQHKKFPGLEAIMEDIIEDVYKHSEVIVTHINNESVIKSYLEKVISTSIITVPKKMNFHAELPHRVVSTDEIIVSDARDIRVDTTLVDKMINAPENVVTPQPAKEEDFTLTEDDLEDVIFEENKSEVVGLEEAVNDELEIAEVEEIEEAPVEDLLNLEEETAEDVSLEEHVEEEILTVEPTPEIEEIEVEPAEETFVLEPQEELDTPACETESLSLNSEPMVEELTLSEDIAEVSDISEELETTEELEEADSLSLDDEEEASDLNVIEEVTDLDSVSLDLESDEESLLPEFGEELEETALLEQEDSLQELAPEDNNLTLAEDEPALSLDISEPVEELEVTAENKTSNFKAVDYSVFEFTPEINTDDIYVDEIAGEIISLSQKRPELNILKVYDLKYKENLSISQIASQIEMSEVDVLEALNEIIAVI